MPIKPKSFVYVCPSCGWKTIVSPRSDVLMSGEYYERCPTCGTKPLTREELNTLSKLSIELFDKFFNR